MEGCIWKVADLPDRQLKQSDMQKMWQLTWEWITLEQSIFWQVLQKLQMEWLPIFYIITT